MKEDTEAKLLNVTNVEWWYNSSMFWVTCTQSAITISALRVLQSCAATADFPTDVAPAMTMTCFPSRQLGGSRFISWSVRVILKLLFGRKWRLVTALDITKSAKRMQWNIHIKRSFNSFSLSDIRPMDCHRRTRCHQETLASLLITEFHRLLRYATCCHAICCYLLPGYTYCWSCCPCSVLRVLCCAVLRASSVRYLITVYSLQAPGGWSTVLGALSLSHFALRRELQLAVFQHNYPPTTFLEVATCSWRITFRQCRQRVGQGVLFEMNV